MTRWPEVRGANKKYLKPPLEDDLFHLQMAPKGSLIKLRIPTNRR